VAQFEGARICAPRRRAGDRHPALCCLGSEVGRDRRAVAGVVVEDEHAPGAELAGDLDLRRRLDVVGRHHADETASPGRGVALRLTGRRPRACACQPHVRRRPGGGLPRSGIGRLAGARMASANGPAPRVGPFALGGAPSGGAGCGLGVQLTAFFTSAAMLFSSAAVSRLSANEVGHMLPWSRFADSLKPNDAYLSLNFDAGVK
jgi:hypothetical protein